MWKTSFRKTQMSPRWSQFTIPNENVSSSDSALRSYLRTHWHLMPPMEIKGWHVCSKKAMKQTQATRNLTTSTFQENWKEEKKDVRNESQTQVLRAEINWMLACSLIVDNQLNIYSCPKILPRCKLPGVVCSRHVQLWTFLLTQSKLRLCWLFIFYWINLILRLM